jgi:hypothetical protein
MAIDFSKGGIFGSRRLNEQYEVENEDILYVTYTTLSINEETAYTVTTGKTFFVSKVIFVNNDNAAENKSTLKFNDNQVYGHDVTRNSSHVLDFQVPVPVLSGQTIKIDMDDIGSVLVVIGWER